ncbi:MAG: glycosyl transferase family 1 [Salinivirgaceae bacterium]|nr:MAG: glycosyl transferase family 1 [Salinivirgaceae bacterium]
MKKRILYIVAHRYNRSPGQRFRCEHFIPWLKENGYEITFSNMLSEWDDKYFYKKGYYFLKLIIVIKSFIKRTRHIRNVKKYDAVYIFREAFMLGTTYFEKKIYKKGVPIIFDFDDAIWLKDISDANKSLSWLKKPEKTAEICKMSDLIIAGNNYLAEYASQYNNNVHVIPTTIDTAYHKRTNNYAEKEHIIIGWTGSSTTIKHFNLLVPVLEELKKKYSKKLKIRVISDAHVNHAGLEIENIPWSVLDEITKLEEIDIGIMPLPNDKWAKGKCGFKGLQYMSMEIPAVMSPVGVNNEIIHHEKNGFLAETDKDWIELLTQLIDNKELRKTIGKNGRKTIEDRFSIEANKHKYLELFNSAIQKKNTRNSSINS